MQQLKLQKVFPALGTANSLTLYGRQSEETANKIQTYILDLHRRFSFFEDDSDVSMINKNAGICAAMVSADTFNIIKSAVKWHHCLNGAFDITAGRLSQLWRQAIADRQLPAAAEIEACRQQTDMDSLVLNEDKQTVFLKRRDVSIDLGGIAKGYAISQIQLILQKSDVESALINLGGTVYSYKRASSVGIQNPFRKTGCAFGSITIQNQTAVTSGFNERCFLLQGRRYHHIIDPSTGWPAESKLASVTLIGQDATALDALATAVFISGIENSTSLLQAENIEAVYVTDQGDIQVTPGLKDRLTMQADSAAG